MTLPQFIGITELRNNARKVFDRLSKDGAPIVVIRESKPEAVIVSYRDFESLMNGEHKEASNVKAEPLSIP
ncbi:MAG: type II toxin-antitoxin system Phd/YefM family antitoxin [bacterium]|nr:type II toxin-antitoxin system Phd/YefM family antitoxin [bacterium]